jgi:hypothetical protein
VKRRSAVEKAGSDARRQDAQGARGAAPGLLGQLQRAAGNDATSSLLNGHAPQAADLAVQRAPAPGAARAAPGAATQEFINKCAEALGYIVGESLLAQSFVEALGVAYFEAYQRHSDVLKDAAADKKLANEVFLDAALAFIPGGGIGGGIAKCLKGWEGGFIVDGLKDIIKTNSDKFGKKGIEAIHGEGVDINPDATNPARFRGDLMARVTAEFGKVATILNAWQHLANDPDTPPDAIAFDPVPLIKEQLKISGQTAEQLRTPLDPADPRCSRIMEKGMWQEWMTTKTWTEESEWRDENIGPGPGATVHAGGFSVPKAARKGIKACAAALGEDGEQWIKDWGGEMYHMFHLRSTYEGEEERWHPDAWW